MKFTSNQEKKIGMLLSYIQIALGSIIGIVYTPIMIRLLGQSEYGIYNLAASIVSYLGVLNFGLGSAYVRFYHIAQKESEEEVKNVNGSFLLIFIILGLVALCAGSVLVIYAKTILGNGLTDNEIASVKRLMAILIVNMACSFPASVFSSAITASEKFIFQKSINIISSVLSPLLILPLLVLGYRSTAIVTVTTILNLIKYSFEIWFCFKKIHFQFSFRGIKISYIKKMFVFTVFIFINMLIDQVNWNIDKFLLGRYAGTTAVAVYSVGFSLQHYFSSFSTAISGVFIPQVNRMVANNEGDCALTELMIKIGRIQNLILCFVLSGFILVGRWFILNIFAGAGYEDSYIVAVILMCSALVPYIQNIGIEIQRAKNKHQFRSVVYGVIAIMNLVISIILCQKYGAIGSSIGTAISLILGNGIIMNIYYYYGINLDMIKFWKEILKMFPPIVCCFFIGLVASKYVDSIFTFLCFIFLYSLLFIVVSWLFVLNRTEKKFILGKIRGKK